TIAKWGKAFIAVDINGELYEEWLKNKDPNKRPAKMLDLTASMGSATGHVSYNPLVDVLQADDGFMAQMCRELVQCILPLSPNERDPFWTVAGQDILTGLILHYVSESMGFLEAIELIQGLPLPMAIQSALKGKSEYAKLLLGQFDTSGSDDEDEDYKNGKMLFSIASTITTRLFSFVVDPVIRAALTPNENTIRWSDLDTHDIFVRIDQSKIDQWGVVINMMLTQLVRHLEQRPNKHDDAGKDTIPILLLLDEFPRLGRVSVIANALSTLRIKNVTIALVLQSLSQLDLHYGRDERRVIMDNCEYLAVLSVNDVETQKYLSDRIGGRMVKKTSRTQNYDTKGKLAGSSYSYHYEYEPYVRPADLATPDKVRLISNGVYCNLHKTPHHQKPKDDLLSTVKKVAEKVVSAVKSVFDSVFGKVKSFFGKRIVIN
ncbi:MAG: type IV secretory system conjugative DNA transfer family protein, partial [Defluviitaleaceae bacterium]|nr:type IV secretory system conjugative DNA transfer family protein [Defluviitaleaceae bacterium]